MSASSKSFVCRVCGLAEGYGTINFPGFSGRSLCLYYCKGCSSVFADPKKFSNPVRKLSGQEIDELIRLGEDFGGDIPGDKIPTDAPNY